MSEKEDPSARMQFARRVFTLPLMRRVSGWGKSPEERLNFLKTNVYGDIFLKLQATAKTGGIYEQRIQAAGDP